MSRKKMIGIIIALLFGIIIAVKDFYVYYRDSIVNYIMTIF